MMSAEGVPFSFALTGANGFAVGVLRWESPELALCLQEDLVGVGQGCYGQEM